MTMYVYHTKGHPVGFRFGSYIHDLDGNGVGRVFGSHVHRLDGSYAGELHKDCVVDKGVTHRRDIQPVSAPANPGPAEYSFHRRGLVDYGYPDVFHTLNHGRADDYDRYELRELAIAAE